jgi:hypothetical protein
MKSHLLRWGRNLLVGLAIFLTALFLFSALSDLSSEAKWATAVGIIAVIFIEELDRERRAYHQVYIELGKRLQKVDEDLIRIEQLVRTMNRDQSGEPPRHFDA